MTKQLVQALNAAGFEISIDGAVDGVNIVDLVRVEGFSEQEQAQVRAIAAGLNYSMYVIRGGRYISLEGVSPARPASGMPYIP
jgi:hypothetical protein